MSSPEATSTAAVTNLTSLMKENHFRPRRYGNEESDVDAEPGWVFVRLPPKSKMTSSKGQQKENHPNGETS
eukprot:scaffold26585_cov131-Skeletonema_menzelii.AAC.2